MNVLLLCSKENLLGNKLVIYSTLYCNDTVHFYMCLLEDIGEKEKQNLINIISYMDHASTINFEEIDETQPLEKQFYYLNNLLYIAADCLISQTIPVWQFEDETLILPIVQKDWLEQRYCTFYINLENTRNNDKETYIKYNNEFITDLIYDVEEVRYFDPRIGFCGKFSFYIDMPILFWFSNENQKIYKTNLNSWLERYEDFKHFVEHIFLAEIIQF